MRRLFNLLGSQDESVGLSGHIVYDHPKIAGNLLPAAGRFSGNAKRFRFKKAKRLPVLTDKRSAFF